MAAIETGGFQPRTLDKVERLLDLLDEMQRHPDLITATGGIIMAVIPRRKHGVQPQSTDGRRTSKQQGKCMPISETAI